MTSLFDMIKTGAESTLRYYTDGDTSGVTISQTTLLVEPAKGTNALAPMIADKKQA